MIVYWDTSALVAVFLTDDCSAQARALWARVTQPVSSWLCFPETRAALKAARESRLISAGDYLSAVAEFEDAWQRFMRHPVKETLAPELRRLFKYHSIRGADATHLATALVMHHRLASSSNALLFACHDRALSTAAEEEGLTLAWSAG